MKTPALRSTVLAAAAFLSMQAIGALAQTEDVPVVKKRVLINCNTMGYKFHPSGLTGEWDRDSLPTSGDSSTASADTGRGADNTAGDIYISTQSAGNTTITYTLKDGRGNRLTVKVEVEVACPDPDHPNTIIREPHGGGGGGTGQSLNPELPTMNLPRAPRGSLTHRLTGCPACKGLETELNAAIDQIAAIRPKLIEDEIKLIEVLHSYPEKIADKDELAAAIKAVNAQQAVVDADQAKIEQLQAGVRDLAGKLNECEKSCNPPAALTPPAPPNETPSAGTPPDKPGDSKTPSLKDQSELRSIEPEPGSAPGKGEGVFAPPIAGPGSTIVATVVDPDESGPHAMIVGTVDGNGKHQYLKTITDIAGKVALTVPPGVVALDLFEHFDPQGKPSTPAHTVVGTTSHMAGSTPLPPSTIPSTGPAILEGSPAIEPGKAVVLHTSGTNPMTAKVLVDGKTLDTSAASDSSIVARLPGDLTLGAHKIQVSSGGTTSNTLHAAAVTMKAEPVPLLRVGQVKTLRVHVEGVPPGQTASMHFKVGGAATLRGGAPSTDVPVKNGIAEVAVQAVRSGQLEAEYNLQLTLPDE
jgi:hypothetical protein